ncbi:MAG: TolC family protein [candidate division KSB1 bacterium]|nr:TolC family protein [candidate division KSB1 bacterium]
MFCFPVKKITKADAARRSSELKMQLQLYTSQMHAAAASEKSARLQLDKLQFEAPNVREKQTLEIQQYEIEAEQARKKLKSLKEANLNYESAVRRYNRDQLDIVYRVTQSFYQLYRATREYEIARQDLKQQTELYDLARQKYDAGLIPQVEALQMEADLAESQSKQVAAAASRERSADRFKQLIGLKLTDDVGIVTDFTIQETHVDQERAIQLALQNRSEIRLGEINVELSKIQVKEVDARRDFHATLSAFYDITGVSSPTLPFETAPRDLLTSSLDDMDRRPNNKGVMFNVSVPIWDWGGNKAAVQAAHARLSNSDLSLQEQKKTIKREVRDVVGRLKETRSQLDVLEKRRDVANRAFDISLKRFDNGDITSQELALDRDRYLNAQLAYLDAYISYQLALAELQRTTMYDFIKNKSLVNGT